VKDPRRLIPPLGGPWGAPFVASPVPASIIVGIVQASSSADRRAGLAAVPGAGDEAVTARPASPAS
jgi:hypothetical protein